MRRVALFFARAAFFRRLFLSAFYLLVVGFALAVPEVCAAPVAKGNSSTRILSEKMSYDSAKNQVVFEGKVHVIRPNMEIWSDVLTIILDNSDKKSAAGGDAVFGMEGGKVERIIAERNVLIKQENKSGSCGKATYFVTQGKIEMEQNPLLVDGDNRIRGQLINYYTETGRSEVIGNVDVQFNTDDKGPSLPGLAPNAGPAASPGKAAQ